MTRKLIRLSACVLAVTAFGVYWGLVDQPASASAAAMCRCQQECDGIKAACDAACYAEHPDEPELSDCLGDCNADYNICSYGACSCEPPEEPQYCFYCVTLTQCEITGYFHVVCGATFNLGCIDVPNWWCD